VFEVSVEEFSMIGVFILADYAMAVGSSLCRIAVKKTLRRKQLDFLSRFNEAERSGARERKQRSWRGTKANCCLRALSSMRRKNSERIWVRIPQS
jgi:hypothetical protein